MKPLVVISAPFLTRSGYGSRSRDIIKEIIKHKYDTCEIILVPTKWGDTPFISLDPNDEINKKITDCTLRANLTRQPDLWIQITVPNEFNPIGKKNVGITASIETTVCDSSWILGVNKMDMVIVSSEHGKHVLETTSYNHTAEKTGKVETLKCTTPIQVLFEGVDTNIYRKIADAIEFKTNIYETLNTIPENFCFLFTGHWLAGDISADRKDVGMLIKTFLETFKNKNHKQVALVLKTSGATFSHLDKMDILNKIHSVKILVSKNFESLPNIYLLHGDLTDAEMNELYNHPKVKAHVSFTKGEGFGRPLLEATLSAKPVIATGYSGHMDFLKYSVILPGSLTDIHHSALMPNMLIAGSKWFTVDYKRASEELLNVYKNYNKYTDNAKKQAYLSKTEYSLDKMGDKLMTILEPHIPLYKPLVLPKLKKIETI